VLGHAFLVENMYEKIEEFLDKHDIMPKKENARSYIFDCPVCGSSDKLYIEKSNGRSICFRHKLEDCPTARTSVVKVLSLLSEVPFDQVKNELAEKVSTTPDEILEQIQDVEDSMLIKDVVLPLEPINPKDYPNDAKPLAWPESAEGAAYLISRRLDLKQLERYGVCYSAYMQRVIFPVVQNGKIYGWQARTIKPDIQPRMYNLPGEWKSRTLMFHDNLVGSQHAIIAEGAVSALKFDLVGGFVATMGKMVSKNQLDAVIKSGVQKIYLALDPDAIFEMEDLVHKILILTNYQIQCFLVKVPDGREDFGDCTYEECAKAFESAELLDFDCMGLYAYSMEKS